MLAYMFNAALLCEECGEEARRDLATKGKAPVDPDDEASYDSDDYPKGPYGNGGGEADTAQHCDYCGLFLANPLTSDGRRYVQTAIDDHHRFGDGDEDVIMAWADFYGLTPTPETEDDPPAACHHTIPMF